MSEFLKNYRKYDVKIAQYDDEVYSKNPLLNFRLRKIRKKKKFEMLKHRGELEKAKLLREPLEPLPVISQKYPKESCLNEILRFVENTPIPRISQKAQEKILQFSPPKTLRNKYPQIVKSYMSEVQMEYDKIMKSHSMHKMIRFKSDNCDSRYEVTPFAFKRPGKTQNYKLFLLHRQKLKNSLFIPYPFIRFIVHLSIVNFPSVLVDLENYRKSHAAEQKWFSLVEFENNVEKDLEVTSIFIKEEWYPKIIKILQKYYKKKIFRSNVWPKILNCAKGLIKRQITELKVKTFQHIFDVLENPMKMSCIKFQAIFTDDNIDLNPNFSNITATFQSIFKHIAAVGSTFPALEPLVDRDAFSVPIEYLGVQISENFMNETLDKLNRSLNVAYSPILSYINEFRNNYAGLYGQNTKNDLAEFLSESRSFEDYLKKIQFYREYQEQLNKMVYKEYINFAIINQTKAISGLKIVAKDSIDEITVHIVYKHRDDCTEISKWFTSVRKRAFEAPKTTETLLANGEFMLLVRNQEMGEIYKRIEHNLRMSGILLELTEFSDEHRNLQVSIVQSLKYMPDIFEQNSAQFEIYKNQFEEHLNNVTRKFVQDIDNFIPKLAIIDDMYETEKLENYYATLKMYMEELQCFEDYARWITKEEKLFKLPVSQYPILDEIKNYLISFSNLVRLCVEWLRNYNVWMDGPFEYLDGIYIDKSVINFEAELKKSQKYYRNRIKQDMMGNPILKFRGQTEDPDPDKHPVPLRICERMIDWIKGFKVGVYIVQIMCNPALHERHWKGMSEIAGFNLMPDAGTTLRKITKLDIIDKLAAFEIISIGANKELQLQNDLIDMTEKWKSTEYPTTTHKDTNIQILANLDDIQVLLEDHIVKTLTMRGSAFVKPCETEVRAWYDKLLRTNCVFDEWAKVQSRWLYYLPIFSSEHIVQQIPKEAELFGQVNRTYRKYMNMIIYDPIVLKTASMAGLLEDLLQSNKLLDDIEIGVNFYLERIRLYFSRFFFLSKFEILQILSEVKSAEHIQPFLNKCFVGIHELDFDTENNDNNIRAMISFHQEKINFKNTIETSGQRGRVEKLLRSIEDEMRITIKNEIILAYSDFLTTDWIDWVLNWPQLIAQLVVQIFWVSDIHACLSNQNRELLEQVIETIKENLAQTTAILRDENVANLTKISLRSLCIMMINARDIIQSLLTNAGDLCATSFQWIAQLKYYWINGEVSVKMIDVTLKFGYEYLGNYDRLVVTPLTERCYRTIVAAFNNHLFAALNGVSGTGKLETFKDLTKALAVQCRIFNCSAEMDHRVVESFLKGLITCGAWMCFENFNRINLAGLSVIAEQMRCLLMIISSKVDQCKFSGVQLHVEPYCYLCIINYSSLGTQAKLPDNLRVLFRTVAMMIPDFKVIAETLLYSYGFTNSESLARKLLTLFEYCNQRLSSSHFYDFGLRNIRAILRDCERYQGAVTENEQICKAILKFSTPKLLTEDKPIFMGILSDLFPALQSVKKVHNEKLLPLEMFENVCLDQKLQPTKELYEKSLEMYEILNIRHSIVIVGKSFSCKTTLIKILSEILQAISAGNEDASGRKCVMEFVNPKSISIKRLFGEFNALTQSWTDGIISSIFRKFLNISSNEWKWLIFDGPIDCEWVENLNTVLDDNKKLCLVSGEIIEVCSGMSIIFETEDLVQASPATISRLSIVHMDSNCLKWQTVAKSWAEDCNSKWLNEHKNLILDIFEWIIPPLLQYLKDDCTHVLNCIEMRLVNTTLDIFKMVMDDAVELNLDDYQKFLISWIQAAAVYSIVWGIGGLLDKTSREQFDHFHRKLWNGMDEHPLPTTLKNRLDISLPTEGNLADYVYLFKQKGAWKLWADLVRRLESEDTTLGTHVYTIDTGRYSHLLEIHIKRNRGLLLVGPNGSGKTCLIQHTLTNKLNQAEYLPAFITFNVGTNANEAQEHLISKLIKLKRNIYGPPKGKQCIAFIDDLNLPAREQHGVQTSVELLRHYFNYEFMFDLKSNDKIFLENILMVCACGIPGGSWHNLSPRFLKHLNAFSINDSSEETLFRIFSNVLLTKWLKKNGHASDVVNHVNQIITAILRTYYFVLQKLKPTPAKSFYRFNVRDISRICNGCALLRKESVDNKKMFAKIWFHESMREFHDRLTDNEERVWLFEKLCNEIRETFKDSVEQILETQVNDDCVVSIKDANRILFGCYIDLKIDFSNRRYEEISNLDKLAVVAKRCLDEYNATQELKLNMVLFGFALEHLNRICRIICIPGGNGLIIGTGDSGRNSLTRLAAFICKQNLFQTNLAKNYGISAWKEDVKRVLKSAGGHGRQTVFLLSENEIRHDYFMADIDHLLNSADIPNLWPIDEQQELVEMVRLSAQGGNRNIDISPLEVFAFFVNRCQQNLHIILCFSPIGATLRTRLRLYPSLLNCCTINWFDIWPEEALEVVAEKYISEIDISEELKRAIIDTSKLFHASVKFKENDDFLRETSKRNYTTSASFLELMYSFSKLFRTKRNTIMETKSRYVNGLETLLRAAEAVENMQIELSELQPKLLAMAENSRLMTVEIEQKTLEASVATEQVKRDELIANDQAAAAESMEDECSKDLAQAVPVLEDALQALNTLKPSDITLVKSMKNPPSAIKLVMAAVCVMKGVPPDRINDAASGKKIIDYWGPSKRILGDMAFLQSLKDYDKDDINPDIIRKIRKDYIPHKDFQPHIVAKASSAAEGLCKWVKAIENFESVNTIVRPKKMKLLKAKELLKETRKFLAEKRALAAELEAKVIGLYKELEKANEEKQRTEKEVEICEKKLKQAEALIGSLESEKIRWTEDASRLQKLYDNLLGDILICSGTIAYLGPFTKSIRDARIKHWHKACVQANIPCSDAFDLVGILGSETDIRNWNIDGLSTDRFSIQNAIIMFNSCRQCLFIDPQRQANKWMRTMESVNQLHVIKFTQSSYFDTLKKCMEFGHPVLIEDIHEKLDILMDPVLRYNVFTNKELKVLYLNEEEMVTISENFRLYLTCNLQNPHFLPDVCSKVNIINFFMDQPGLEEKLLNVVVAKERPDIREQRDKLIVEKAKDEELLNKCENDILTAIAESKGDILENQTAIKKMDDSKRVCMVILQKQPKYAETERGIESFRNEYKTVAQYAAIIYGCLIDLVNVNTMYQFSLEWFINLYNYSIENSNRSQIHSRRIHFLTKTITKHFYNSVCRSIFEKDKFLFSWILTTKILLAENRMNVDQLKFFISGKIHCEEPIEPMESACPDWVQESVWRQLIRLKHVTGFENFQASFMNNINEWKKFYGSDMDLLRKVPIYWRSDINNLEKLILIKIFHSESIIVAIKEFVSEEMDATFINPPQFDIGQSFEESTILTPLIFLLSPGVDPIESLILFAKRLGMVESLQIVSLGNDQHELAEKMVKEAQMQGSWICLQNCHLSTLWLLRLETIWSTMNIYNTTSSFRLWMTTEETNKFPLNLLQSGIKMTYERPNGLQCHLLRTYSTKPVCDSGFYNGCPGKDRAFARLLFSLAFFHAVVQERRHFGSHGWNNVYNFSKSDFDVSIYQLSSFLNQEKNIPYDALNYLIGECNYGGRITDKWDFRVVKTLLSEYINEQVVTNFSYRFANDDTFILPRRTEHREILKFIKDNIPNEPTCEVYGLNNGVDIIRNTNLADKLFFSLSTIMKLSLPLVYNTEFEENIADFVFSVKEKLPQSLDISANMEKIQISPENPFYSFLTHEAECFNVLLQEMQHTFTTLEKVLEGSDWLTPEVEDICTMILNNEIPLHWRTVSYSTTKTISSFVTDFCNRFQWIRKCLENGIPTDVWLSAFFHPDEYLLCLKQVFAREQKQPLENITFTFRVCDDQKYAGMNFRTEACTEEGACVHGLYLEGAQWNPLECCIDEQSKNNGLELSPKIHIIPTSIKDAAVENVYECPLYRTLSRSGQINTIGHSDNFLIAIQLPTKINPRIWIKRGVALFCQTND